MLEMMTSRSTSYKFAVYQRSMNLLARFGFSATIPLFIFLGPLEIMIKLNRASCYSQIELPIVLAAFQPHSA